jgi:L-fucose isomerase-like protein
MDLSDDVFLDAVRAHSTVNQLLERHDADAITIECLFLKHRKPCLSFAMNNGALVPCGCENDLNATLTLMLGSSMFGRGGFQHNPEFDLEENRYMGAHCTCTPLLHGPKGKAQTYDLRPFFHQAPKTVAFDVQWPEKERVTMCKYHGDEECIYAWAGESVVSPTCPPVGGCATRVLVKFDNMADVCQVYPGIHPIMYCGDWAKQLKVFAKLYDIEIKTNI